MKSKNIYLTSVNAVIDYIEDHIENDLRLSVLSRVAGFSPYHFHRIFSAFTGETIHAFIRRVRLEKAATSLIQCPSDSITSIAYTYGFSSSQAFARDFSGKFGCSPSAYRVKSKICTRESKKRNAPNSLSDYHVTDSTWKSERRWLTMDVEVKNFQDIEVAYLRHTGPFKGNAALFSSLFKKLGYWAGPKGLLTKDTLYLAVYHDNPDITDEQKLRMSVCISVPKDTKVGGEIGNMTISGGTYAVAHVILHSSLEYEGAWKAFYKDWLPESGYEPDNRPCFEIYHNDPDKDPEHKHIVSLCLAVKKI